MNTKKKKKVIYKFYTLLIFLCCLFLISCKKEEPIIYGDIDTEVKTVEIKKPKSINSNGNIIGNTYMNLLQGGLITEDEDNYYYIANYENENYLIKENKNTQNKEKLFKGNLRNLFIINNWIYAIENLNNNEQMIVMDIYGNNIYNSSGFKKEIRTMISDGEKIYFTLDASNLINMELKTAIYSCDMDFNNIKTEKLANNVKSQIDLLTIDKNKIYFNETYNSETNKKYIYVNISKDNFPIIENDDIQIANTDFINNKIGENLQFISINKDNKYIYLSAFNNKKNYIILYDINTDTYKKLETDSKILNIYILEDLICYDGNTYFKLKTNKEKK